MALVAMSPQVSLTRCAPICVSDARESCPGRRCNLTPSCVGGGGARGGGQDEALHTARLDMETLSARVAALEAALAAAEARAVESDNRRLAAEAYAKDCAALRQRIEEAAAAAAASRAAAGGGVRAGARRLWGLGAGSLARGLVPGNVGGGGRGGVGGTGGEDGDEAGEAGVSSADPTGRVSGSDEALSRGANKDVETTSREEHHASTGASNTEAAKASAIGWGSYMLGLTGGSVGNASAVDTAGEEEAGAQPAKGEGSAGAAAQRLATTDSLGFPKIDSDGLRGTLRSINANVASSSAGATAALSAAVDSVGHTVSALVTRVSVLSLSCAVGVYGVSHVRDTCVACQVLRQIRASSGHGTYVSPT